jgi:hypothetical protein
MGEGGQFSRALQVDGEEKQIVDKNRDKVVIIDPSPIKTTDFNLTDTKKQLLIASGRLGALKYMQEHHKYARVNTETIEQLNQKVTDLREQL